MAAKKTLPTGANPQAFVTYSFPKGPMRLPWVKLFCDEIRQWVLMTNSDDPILRTSGSAALHDKAQEIHDNYMELYLLRLKDFEVQSRMAEIGEKGRASRWGERRTEYVQKLIASLAMSRDQLGKPLKALELWPMLYAGLDDLTLGPIETPKGDTTDKSRMTWEGNPEGITFKTFGNQLAAARGVAKK